MFKILLVFFCKKPAKTNRKLSLFISWLEYFAAEAGTTNCVYFVKFYIVYHWKTYNGNLSVMAFSFQPYSMTGITQAVVCAIMSVEWCI